MSYKTSKMMILFLFYAFTNFMVVVVSSVSLDTPLDQINSTIMSEMIIGMMEGKISYPQYNIDNIDEFKFRCEDQALPGYYADPDYGCQVVHQCDQERRISGYHVCPNMTVFHQAFYTCFWAPFVDCESSPKFYYLNELLYVVPPPSEEQEPQENDTPEVVNEVK